MLLVMVHQARSNLEKDDTMVHWLATDSYIFVFIIRVRYTHDMIFHPPPYQQWLTFNDELLC